MTARQVEQVTPRIHPKHTNQGNRAWQQPKIRLHNSVHSTPPTVTRFKRSHEESRFLNTTPVTHPTIPKPLRFRIAGTHPEHHTICRRLFPNSTPTKRPRHATPSFRLSCGRDRTQPSPGRARNILVDALDANIKKAQENVRIFRKGLSTNCIETAFQAAIREGLLFHVTSRCDNLLVLMPHSHHSDQHSIEFVVVVTGEMHSEQTGDGKQVNYAGHSVFIPHPWHAERVHGFNSSSFRILIAAHNLEIFRMGHFAVPENLAINTALDNHPLLQVTAEEADSPCPGPVFRFDDLSPHSSTTNLSVFVDFCEPSHQLAVIRDDIGELAVLVTSMVLEARSRKYILNRVTILPHRIQSYIILEALGNEVDERLHNRLAFSGDEKTLLTFKDDSNLEAGSV